MSDPASDTKDGHYASLKTKIGNATIAFSSSPSPGGGSHAAWVFGSPCPEQAAAFWIRSRALEWIFSEPSVPRDADEYGAFLRKFLAELKGFVVKRSWHEELPKFDPAGWGDNCNPAGFCAAEAMRQVLVGIVLQELIDLRASRAW